MPRPKLIFVTNVDEDKDPEYVQYLISNNEQLALTFKNGKGLIRRDDPKRILIDFEEIRDGEYYFVYDDGYLDFSYWQENEADAMETETLLSLKQFLKENLQPAPEEIDGNIYNTYGTLSQEWNGIFLSGDTLYLLEAKHAFSNRKIIKLVERLNQFPQILKKSRGNALSMKAFNKVVCVAAGTDFPEDCRYLAHRFGLMVIYPSGVQSGKIGFNYNFTLNQ